MGWLETWNGPIAGCWLQCGDMATGKMIRRGNRGKVRMYITSFQKFQISLLDVVPRLSPLPTLLQSMIISLPRLAHQINNILFGPLACPLVDTDRPP
jgi:hypothetical protein